MVTVPVVYEAVPNQVTAPNMNHITCNEGRTRESINFGS